MILAPYRSNPPRYRERSTKPSRTVNGTFEHFHEDGSSSVDATSVVLPADFEWMYDSPTRIANHNRKYPWKDCQHGRIYYEYKAADWTNDSCQPDCLTGLDDSASTSIDWIQPVNHINTVQSVISNPYVQAKLHNCLSRWHDTLYNFNAAALPDVSVMLMEDLPQLKGSLAVIVQLAEKAAKYIEIIRDLRFELDRRLLKKSNMVQLKRIKEEIQSYGKLYLGVEFALKQNARSAVDLIAGIAGGAWPLTYDERQTSSVREIAKFSTHGDETLCPGWAGERTAQTLETVEVRWCITTDSTLSVRGNNLERAIAKFMAKAGILPSIASIWEATPYSWLIDYVFRTGLLLRYVERANNIGFTDLDIFNLSFSVHIKIETERVAGKHIPAPGKLTKTTEIFERCVSPDLNFPSVLEWVKLPHGDQYAKAIAFFMSKF